MKIINRTLLVLLSLTCLIVINVFAMGKKPPVMKDNSFEAKLALQFNVEKPLVMSLRDMGYNEEDMIRVLLIHITTEVPIVQITNMYKQGTKWDDIASKYEIDPDTLNKETINRLIYLGLVKKSEHTENDAIENILNPIK